MGNEHSRLTGIDIEDKAIEISDFWSQHSANFKNSPHLTNITLFIGDIFIKGPLWNVHTTPLERCSKNLMIYRHPCILKYISSWIENSKLYLAVENVKPLSHLLGSLGTLQISVGLFSVLKGLCFLHEKASCSHNNLSISSIYVTCEGSWKLGAVEFLCKYEELTSEYLRKYKSYRYNKGIDPKEEDFIRSSKEFVDTYAFFNLVSEVFKIESDSEIPSVKSFVALCKNSLKNNLNERPKLNDLLNHDIFRHEFILIYSFLEELPLKSEKEKASFFSDLSSRLTQFNENLVAGQLGYLLLSRMVLINNDAQEHLIPKILCFRTNEESSDPLFSEPAFKKYLVPRLLEIFRVRDAQIRSVLLKHFSNYVYAFSEEELQSYILPELLVGIKDTNDHLVSITLKALADLVPILGAGIVIGGKRGKLFTDGRPTSGRKIRPKVPNRVEPEITGVNLDNFNVPELPERPRPDGEEVEDSTDEVEPSADEELEWEEWGNDNEQNQCTEVTENSSDNVTNLSEVTETEPIDISIISSIQKLSVKSPIEDIDRLDIKNQKSEDRDDIDFFGDMEPTIETPPKLVIDSLAEVSNTSSKLGLVEDVGEDGWGDEEWE